MHTLNVNKQTSGCNNRQILPVSRTLVDHLGFIFFFWAFFSVINAAYVSDKSTNHRKQSAHCLKFSLHSKSKEKRMSSMLLFFWILLSFSNVFINTQDYYCMIKILTFENSLIVKHFLSSR